MGRCKTKSWRKRQAYAREQRQRAVVAERLGAGTDELIAGGGLVCPLCSFTMDCSLRYQSSAIAMHPTNPNCPNSDRAWVMPRVRLEPVPQADVDAIREANYNKMTQAMQQLGAQAGTAGMQVVSWGQGVSGGPSLPPSPTPSSTYIYRYGGSVTP